MLGLMSWLMESFIAADHLVAKLAKGIAPSLFGAVGRNPIKKRLQSLLPAGPDNGEKGQL
jgi:hypothetical protein